MPDFTVFINGKKYRRYHGYTAEGICKLGRQIAQEKPKHRLIIVDDNNNLYFEYEPIKRGKK